MREKGNSFVVLVAVLSGIATLVGLAITIYSFVTGENSIAEGRKVDTLVQSMPTVANGGIIEHVKIEEYRPLVWLPKSSNGEQTMYAVEPASGALWWYKPSWVLSLTCNADQTCTGTRLFPVSDQLGYIDTLTISDTGKQLLALNRDGVGAIYTLASRRYFHFSFELPCARMREYQDAASERESRFTVQSVDFSEDKLQLRLNATNCAGTAKIRNQRFEITGHAPDWVSQRKYYELLLSFSFAGNYIASSSVERSRYEFNERVPPWFRWASEIPTRPDEPWLDDTATHQRIAEALSPYAGDRLQIMPNISPKVLDGALSAGEVDARDLVALIDMSTYRDGVDGVYFTTKGVASRFSRLPRYWVPYDRIVGTPVDGAYAILYGNYQVALAPSTVFVPNFPKEQLIEVLAAARDASRQPPAPIIPTIDASQMASDMSVPAPVSMEPSAPSTTASATP